ncbi:ribosome silencing factor [Levilactobacillus bambusae]|uniref:Ribosomal silencing factor RsfS n=1 Tax=Levilactobacillus bambusae TaxID=2024736 RepID=A0A2V1N237_9LACO|nr:ribosome silencing factor [Levilactobacillus bambusae]PWG01023.1 ribosome silencing factor [Levilactobacillus bambusae]
MNSKEILEIAVKAADSKRAENIVALNLDGVSLVSDYFLIMDAGSGRQVQAIVDAIKDAEEKAGVTVKSVEGKDAANWILMDLGDVVVHVFKSDQRGYYNLEKLWSQAPAIDVAQWVTE